MQYLSIHCIPIKRIQTTSQTLTLPDGPIILLTLWQGSQRSAKSSQESAKKNLSTSFNSTSRKVLCTSLYKFIVRKISEGSRVDSTWKRALSIRHAPHSSVVHFQIPSAAQSQTALGLNKCNIWAYTAYQSNVFKLPPKRWLCLMGQSFCWPFDKAVKGLQNPVKNPLRRIYQCHSMSRKVLCISLHINS